MSNQFQSDYHELTIHSSRSLRLTDIRSGSNVVSSLAKLLHGCCVKRMWSLVATGASGALGRMLLAIASSMVVKRCEPHLEMVM